MVFDNKSMESRVSQNASNLPNLDMGAEFL